MPKQTLYLECYSGISGDMTVAALLDLGADEQVLKASLDSLNISGYKIEIGRTQKCGIAACNFDVILEHTEGHIHIHHKPIGKARVASYTFKQVTKHTNTHNDSHSHDHDHDHEHEHTHTHNDQRNINDIIKIIEESKISNRAKTISKKIFDIIAIAESKAHGIAVDEVHFHEVGAIDSIVDIVAVAVCIDNLNIGEVIISELYEGSGHVKCQHGVIPVPVPAVINIVTDSSLTIRITDARGEMITPTGAAIAAALKTRDSLPKSYRILKVGIGAGKKDFAKANILRACIIEEAHKDMTDEIWVLETNLDDCTGENLGFIMDKLLEIGANDVFFTPIYMKKNRPAYRLSVICREESIKAMEATIFKNSTSIGIRKYKTLRTILEREIIEVDTQYGQVRVKVCYFENEKYFYPEYDDIKEICNRTGEGFKKIYDEVNSIQLNIN